MNGRGLFFFLLFLGVQQYSGLAALCARRSLSANTAIAGTLLEVAIGLSSTDSMPSAFILTETLPDGLQFLSAIWNEKPFVPEEREAQMLKWFFGPGGKTVSEGILKYQLRVQTGTPQKVFFAGSLQELGAGCVPVSGERILWLNPLECSAPVFSPESETVFEEELRISLLGDSAAGGDFFFCFGEPESWDDWLPYEGAFFIHHSQQLHAQSWLADGRASPTANVKYYRRGNCPIPLQRGWNLIGIPLELSAKECLKLQEKHCILANNTGYCSPEKLGRCGQVLWIFSPEDDCLLLTGLEPFERGVQPLSKAGWEAVAFVGLQENMRLKTTETFWTWENNCYRLATQLQPGIGYWQFQLP
ncbi:MAG: hypothetical protein PHY82_00450 [Lentisphaeria bacterium]|nr:hypothetical protein [Lentisphaeria bacterium]